jgi:hypothetical protein
MIGRAIIDVPRFVDDLLDAAKIATRRSVSGERVTTMNAATAYNENCVPDHKGEDYRNILQRLHADFGKPTYLEIGTLTGATLALSNSPSIAIDPAFQVSTQVIGAKELCLFFQMESDAFFAGYDPKALLGRPIEFAFLDGMHRCEFLLRDFINTERHSSPSGIIALHDCLPVDVPMTDRTQNGTPPALPHRAGWWTGDVWRTVVALKKYRPELRIICLDAAPTGLVLIANLDPTSSRLAEKYQHIVEEMLELDLATVTLTGYLKTAGLRSTADFVVPGALVGALGNGASKRRNDIDAHH